MRTAKKLDGITWWTKSLRTQRQKCRALRRKINKVIGDEEKAHYLALYRMERASYKRNILTAKTTSWKRFCTTNANPFGILHKICTNKVFRPHQLHLQQAAGSQDNNLTSATATITMDAIFPPDDPTTDTAEQRSIRQDTTCPDTANDMDFSMQEISEIFRILSTKKAPGPDGLDYNILKTAFAAQPAFFLHLFNGLFKLQIFPTAFKTGHVVFFAKKNKDPQDPRSLRPICLLPAMGKIYEKLLVQRLSHHPPE
ncbi:uncharacterized protein LOC118192564 [Stegodyphus dumicola]|uniref:uncharacterized protein LOC118192564 n=1 Tax=Stegodyphus dumicola TaxID=202533 RepID=UPI0015ACD666|nr:uncharacterized protein LOC118192564 [Stegodyphus dumicola]